MLQPLAGTAGVLSDGHQLVGLDVLEGGVGAPVEVVEIRVELGGNHVDLDLRGIVDVGELVVDVVLAGLHGEVGGADHLSGSLGLPDLEDELAVEGLGDGDDLGVSLVGARIERENLGVDPSRVVDGSETDLSSNCRPSLDAAVEVVPSCAHAGGGEITVDDQVRAIVDGKQSDVIDGEAVGVAERGSVELQNVLACVEDDIVGGAVESGVVVLAVVERIEDDVVPEDVTHGGIEGNGSEVGPHCPAEFEPVGEGGAGEGVFAGGDVAVGDLSELVVESEILGDLVVGVSVELDHLAESGGAEGIGAEADFDAGSEPSVDVVEDVPGLEDVGA